MRARGHSSDSPPRRLDARRLPAVTMWRALLLVSAALIEPAFARCKACSHKKLYKGNCGALYKKRGSRWGEWLCENQPVYRVHKSFLGDDAAVPARPSGEEPASSRHRAGVASMAWRSIQHEPVVKF